MDLVDPWRKSGDWYSGNILVYRNYEIALVLAEETCSHKRSRVSGIDRLYGVGTGKVISPAGHRTSHPDRRSVQVAESHRGVRQVGRSYGLLRGTGYVQHVLPDDGRRSDARRHAPQPHPVSGR